MLALCYALVRRRQHLQRRRPFNNIAARSEQYVYQHDPKYYTARAELQK